MHPTLETTETRAVTDDHAVRDFDELDDAAQAVFNEATEADGVPIPEETADAFEDGELVRFTGYYRVDIAR
ncbi:MAG: hypothetical protein ABEJ88_03950 [Halobacterium sp.]